MMGGPSAEREVSLKSGHAVSQALESLGHQVLSVDPKDGVLQIPEAVDAVFLALHGTYGEDGEVQLALESRGLPYTGSGPESSRLAFDKLASKRIFLEQGLPTPDFVTVVNKEANLPSELGGKLVVKPICQVSSVGLHFAACVSDASGGEWRLQSSSRKVPQNPFLELRLPWEAD